MSGFRPVWTHASLRAVALSQKRRDSLVRGEIDHGFHYQGVKQSQLWLEVHRCHAPLFSNTSFIDIFHAIAADTAAELAGQAVHVIGLGSGGGEKEAWLLQALRNAGCSLRYTPVDTSLELALLSAEAAAPYLQTDSLPIVGDLSLLAELSAWLARYPSDEVRVYTAFGLTPNFLPSQLFGGLSNVLRPQDVLLLSANLAPVSDEDSGQAYRAACETLQPQYDNPETKAWLRQILLDWGIAADLSEPVFQVEALENLLGFVASSEWLSEVGFPWEGQFFQAQRGARLRLFFSLRYTPKRLAETLKRWGLALEQGYLTDCGQEGVWRVARHCGGGF